MLLYSLFASILSPHFLNTLDLTIFMPYLLSLYFFFIFIWSLGGKKKIIHSNTQTITIHEGCSSVFQSLPRCHPLLSLFHPGDFSYTRGVHHKQIMSNCKCLCFLKGADARVNWVSLPPSSGFASPARSPTELGFESGRGSSVRDQNGLPPVIFCPSPEYPCVWVDRLCVCTHAGNCKHIRIHKHTQQLPTFHCVIKQRVTQRSRKRCCSLLISC